MGLDHVGIVTADVDKTLGFYLAALKPLGYRCIVNLGSGTVNGLGSTFPDLWISSMAPLTTSDPSNPPPPHPHPTAPLHLCFSASSRKQVREFHNAALAAGAKCNGPPGIRAMYHRWYYGAFVWDSEGRNIEVCCHRPMLVAEYGWWVMAAVVGGLVAVAGRWLGVV